MTEYELRTKLGIPELAWNQLIRGIRRPTHSTVYALMQILGDEVQSLFYGYYIDDPFPKMIPANEYQANKVSKSMQKYIEKIKQEGKEFRYLNRK